MLVVHIFANGAVEATIGVTLKTWQNSALAAFPNAKLGVKMKCEIVIYDTEQVCYVQITIQK